MAALQENDRPVAWLAAAGFGVGSQVWMHRQASGMARLDLRVITHNYDQPDRFPPNGFSVEEINESTPLSKNRLVAQSQLAMHGARNLSRGGFRGSVEETNRWVHLLKEHKPAVVLCHFGPIAVRMAPLFSSYGVPIVAHFNGYDLSSGLRKWGYRTGLQKWAPRFAGNVVVANYMREELEKIGCDPARIHKIPYGAPMPEMIEATQVGAQPCRFLMVGRLTDKKRPDLSLRAFALCRETCPDARLIVIGDGPLMDRCKAVESELGLAGHVEWLGAQPNDEVKRQLGAAGVFVQHSVTAESGDKEGWPVAIGEAAASGLPIASTRHASIPEQVEHGETGLLCDELDWRAMGENMARLASDPELRASMGRAARAKLAAMDTEHQVKQLEDVLLNAARQPVGA